MTFALKELRGKTDDELVEWLSGWKEGTKFHIAGMIELRRRQERPNEIRGWAAIFFSAFAILISVFALITKSASGT
ncbi:MAG: hypothetical protein HOM25_00360 [Rhodospirillaceae bacterium]|jgi:hypothetical protein|nr:hypothetical protein [Rhodospirillaceae bacterium]MBT5667620.1 hypothetical protein [Rhodospirillaceae bacterium]MBT5808882.1 hypothetical protein [Rhodospirillaceae bacterium]